MQQGLSPNFAKNCTISSWGSPGNQSNVRRGSTDSAGFEGADVGAKRLTQRAFFGAAPLPQPVHQLQTSQEGSSERARLFAFLPFDSLLHKPHHFSDGVMDRAL